MSRLIDADALIDNMVDYVVDGYAESRDDFEEYTKMVQTAPTIDAVSVVHGEWIFRREFVEDTPFTGYRCSNCNYWQGMGAWNFCPNCGAKMDGEREGE